MTAETQIESTPGLSPDFVAARSLSSHISNANVQQVYAETPIGTTLQEQLLLLAGYDADTDERGQPNTMAFDEAKRMKLYLEQRLPAILTNLALDPTVKTSHSGYDNGEGFYEHIFTQEWGEVPSPDDIQKHGTIMEFAGPTEGKSGPEKKFGFRPDVVSNFITVDGVNVLADASKMPVRDKSLGGVFVSCLPGRMGRVKQDSMDLRPKTINEATRAIMDGGMLFWMGGSSDDLDKIIGNGFMPVYLETATEIPEKIGGDPNNKFYPPHYGIDGVYVKLPLSGQAQ